MPKSWFIIHTYSGFEKKVAEGLVQRAKAHGVEDQIGRAAALFHLGSVRSFDLEYTLDLSALPPGPHSLTVVVRDGTVQHLYPTLSPRGTPSGHSVQASQPQPLP